MKLLSSSAKVNDKDQVVSMRRKRRAAKHEKHKAKVKAKKEAEADFAKIVEDLSRTYGYALLGSVLNIVFVLGVSALPLTTWLGDGKASGGEGATPIPSVNRLGWGVGFWGSFIIVIAAVCTFGTAQGSPRLYPGIEISSWDCALPCFLGMLLSGCTFFGITYLLPVSQRASPEFYFLDVIPVILTLTVGIILTRILMRAYLDFAQGEQDHSTSTDESKGKNYLTANPAASRRGSKKDKKAKESSSIWKTVLEMANIFLLAFLILGAPSTTDLLRFVFVCIVHPMVQELIMTIQRLSAKGVDKENLSIIVNDPKYHYHALRTMHTSFLLEFVFVMYRRQMLGCMVDPTANILAVVVTALEEAIMRSTMVQRDNFFRWLQGLPELKGTELEHMQRVWSASTATSMYIEFVAIITSRVMYLAFRPHRFVVSFGYGFDANDDVMTGVALLISSMFVEIAFEAIVDAFALSIEYKHGIDLKEFWKMWRVNAAAFFGADVFRGAMAVTATIWAFKLFPNVVFCTSPTDPCSCKGGGFEIFEPFCNPETSHPSGNETNATNLTTATPASIEKAEKEFQGIFDALAGDSTTVLVSVGVVLLVAAVFAVARSQLFAAKAKKEKDEIEEQRLDLLDENEKMREENKKIQEENKKMQEQNKKIQDQLMLTQLNAKQAAIVEANSIDIDDHVPAALKLNWRALIFEGRLGSGSFGDCFKGRTKGGRHVAIKRMRSGLVDENGFNAFRREVVMLSRVDHINIVGFVGYCMDPFLLIVMDFVSGGTLRDLVENHDPVDPPSKEIMMKILIGSAKGFAYLHATEPMPILHRDIKSENILLTEDFEARVADLGEARVIAEDHAMTMVGTPGYTAPEVLRGEHYDTSADVFSFAIVVCELLTLRAPYSDMMKNDKGESLLTWPQITAMTQKKEDGLRPSLPDEMDDDMVRLVHESWSGDAALRPSFSVIVVRLEGIRRRGDGNFKDKKERILSAKISNEKNVLRLCRGLHDLLYHYKPAEWSDKKAFAIVDEEATVTAINPTLHEILSMEKGPACIKSLAWMMFGGLEDGAEIIIEPLLDEDVTIDLQKNSALVAMNFGVKPPQKRHQWTGKDKREFDNLEQALAEAEKAMEAHGAESLHEAVSAKETEAKTKPKRKLKRKRPRRIQNRWRRNKNKKKDDPFMTFVKAAKFVRGMGAGTIHPSAKLRLFGLLMQAQRGNIDQGEDFDVPGLEGSALALQKLKLRAWRSQKDKKREDAMKEYVELVTSLAPQWKVAHILGGRESAKNDKPRRMMWVLKVNYREETVEERLASRSGMNSASVAILDLCRVTSLEVLQSSNATSARLWAEDGVGLTKGKEREDEEAKKKAALADSASGGMGGEAGEEQDENDQDPFIANMPKDWSLSDCIVDKSKFKTIEDQRAHFQERMREMARAGRDEEDGWKFYRKATSAVVAESEQYVSRERGLHLAHCPPVQNVQLQLTRHTSPMIASHLDRLDVWHRNVPWSQSKQLRTVLETELSVDDVFEFLHYSFAETAASVEVKRRAKSEKLKNMVSGSLAVPFVVIERNTASCLTYRKLPLPWPLTDRDLLIVQDYVRVTSDNDGGMSDRTWFYTYNHDVDHHYFAPRSGFVRAKTKYQGMVGVLGDEGKTRLTWLVNMDFGGAVPTSFMNGVLANLMFYPAAVVEQTTELLQQQEDAAYGKSAHKSEHQSEERNGSGNEATLENKPESPAELKLRAELAEMKAEMARKDEEHRVVLAGKDEEHRVVLAGKDEELKTKEAEIQELRRRLPRSRVGEEEGNCGE